MTRVLEERGIPVRPVLALVTTVGTENVFLALGTLTGRVQLLVPSHPDAVAAVAPSATMPAGRSMLLVSACGTQPLAAAAVIGGAVTAQQAVDEVAPPTARTAWLSLIESVSGGSIRNRTRYLTEERGSVTIAFAERSGAVEALFAHELATLATRLGVQASWRRLYDEAGAGAADVGVTTECTHAGPAPRLALRFGSTGWNRAIDLAKAMVDIDRARGAAVRMGGLAGALEIETLRGVE
ncbi:MAG TPA: hypothetical protein VGP71_01810, partial [Burkholderiales bacterium]|nr:hypothetical protein [Burkholderiales bacterium]